MPPKKAKNKKRNRRRNGDETLIGFPVVQRTDRGRTIVRVPPNCQLFPDEYICSGVTEVLDSVDAVTSKVLTWKLNGPFNLFGPQFNNTGAFSGNVPAGSNAIIGSSVAAGSTPPYNRCVVTSVDIEIMPIGNAGGTFGSIPCRIVAFPSTNISASAMPISVACEQPGAVFTLLTPQNTAAPVILRNHVKIHEYFGVSQNEVMNNLDYSQVAGSDPNRVLYLQVLFTSADGTSNLHLTVQYRFKLRMRFNTRNPFNSSAPTIGELISRSTSSSSTCESNDFVVVKK